MKRQTAKEILAASFRELAQEKTVDKITVREVTANCGYSQATFYRQFQDKYDLIAWDYAQGVAAIMQKIGQDGYPWSQTLLEGAEHFEADRAYLENLLRHTEGHDSFVRYMAEINFNALKAHIQRQSGMDELPERTVMYIRLYCLGTVSLTCEWVFGKYEASPAEMAEVFLQSLPQPLHPYLL